MLLHMYNKSSYTQNGNSSDKELIDISSDDDVSKIESKTEKNVKASEPVCNVNEDSLHTSATIISKAETAVSQSTSIPKSETSVTKPETSITKPETHAIKSELPVKSKNVCTCMHNL